MIDMNQCADLRHFSSEIHGGRVDLHIVIWNFKITKQVYLRITITFGVTDLICEI